MCGYLGENVSEIDESHECIRVQILEPLKSTLSDFSTLKSMLEECIDISAARQNDYVINPNFDDSLKELSADIG